MVGPRAWTDPNPRRQLTNAVGAPAPATTAPTLPARTPHDEGNDEQKQRPHPAAAARGIQVVPALQRTGAGSDLAGLAPAPTATATALSSTARRCGRRSRPPPTTGCRSPAPTGACPHQGNQPSCCRCASLASRSGRSIRSPESRSSTRQSSPTPSSRPRTWWAPWDGWRVLQTALGYERRLMGDLAYHRRAPANRRSRRS